MKKKILTTAILASIAGVAHAQSSVSLYGIVDVGLDYVNHTASGSGATASNGHNFKMTDGVSQGNRWGLRGSEDLGNGLKAIFTLESGFSMLNGSSGQGGNMFGRQAWVGISKDGIGQVTLGRQYTFNTDYLGANYSTGGNTAAGNYAYHTNDIDQLTNSRINSAIKFSSANFYGLSFGAMYGFSNVAGDFGGNTVGSSGGTRTYSFGLKYAYGPFSLGAAIMDTKNPKSSQYTGATGQSTFTSFTFGSITGGSTSVSELRSFGIGGNYLFGPATLWALWTNTAIMLEGAPQLTYNVYEVGGKYAFTPALYGGLGYTYSRLSNGMGAAGGSAHWNQINAVVDYAFSKRTDTYLLAIYQRAGGRIDGVNASASIGDSASSYFGNSGTANNQIAVRVGLRHKF